MHHGQSVEGLGKHLACGNLGGGLASEEIHLFGTRDLLGQSTDVGRRHAADSLSPLGGLRLLVVGAQHIVFEVILRVGPLGHVLGIEAHAVLVKKCLILQIVLDHMVGHADAESRVGTRNNGHPLISYSLGRLVQPRLHDDDLATLSLGIVELIGGVATLVGHPVVAKVEV